MYGKLKSFVEVNKFWFESIRENENENENKNKNENEIKNEELILNKRIDENGNLNFTINSQVLDIDSSLFGKCLNPDFSINKIENLRTSNKNSLDTFNLVSLNLDSIVELYRTLIINGNVRINLNDFHFNLNDLPKEIIEKINSSQKINFNKNVFKKKEKIKFKKYKL